VIHYVEKGGKVGLLKRLMAGHKSDRALVFARTKHGAERLMKSLDAAGFAAGSIHGNKSQGQRDRALAAFKEGRLKVLVATDVAARGIDIPEVKFVYNFDLPNVPENYVHRIGRTARAGANGTAIAFCSEEDVKELRQIEKVIGGPMETASGTPWITASLAGKPDKKPARPGQRRRAPKRGYNANKKKGRKAA